MTEQFSVTRARALFSQIINRVIYNKENFIITRRGKKVAVILPFDELQESIEGELMEANPLPGALKTEKDLTFPG